MRLNREEDIGKFYTSLHRIKKLEIRKVRQTNSIQFKVNFLFEKEGYLIVEQLEKEQHFEVNDTSTLNEIAIEAYLFQPRAVDSAGNARTDLFIFHLKNKSTIHQFTVGETITLKTITNA